MIYALKAEIANVKAKHWGLLKQKTMYGGQHLAVGDVIYIFDSNSDKIETP